MSFLTIIIILVLIYFIGQIVRSTLQVLVKIISFFTVLIFALLITQRFFGTDIAIDVINAIFIQIIEAIRELNMLPTASVA